MTAWIVRIVIWVLVAIRPSYRLLLFCVGLIGGVGYWNAVFNGTWAQTTIAFALAAAIILVVGVPIIAFRKWLAARKAALPIA